MRLHSNRLGDNVRIPSIHSCDAQRNKNQVVARDGQELLHVFPETRARIVVIGIGSVCPVADPVCDKASSHDLMNTNNLLKPRPRRWL